ncbi:enoyl-CoA hydratase-related protein [Streptomyces fungicidicus]|uniref:enoyl-CoA hydratase-related protein n=1 Tax=Streptomyces fungicidicus TaxID=68203 RepID=UPI00224C04A5|nr:enoyl-CoA hydratase-related protein [Streptomyces fungicidicus]
MSPFTGSAARTSRWEHLRVDLADGVATVTLARPDKLNALTFGAYADLRDLLAELARERAVRALVLAGEGRGFCSGGDVDEIIGATLAMDTAELLDFNRMTGQVVRAIRECPFPVVAAVHGVAAGAGAVLALAADFRVADAGARFAFLFTRSACRAATWARPICCPGWSAWATPPGCSCWETRYGHRRPSASA